MERKENDYAEGIEVGVSSVEVETSSLNKEEVTRITFVTDKGKITYKPKVAREEYREGMKIKSVVSCFISDLPDKIKEIAKEANEKGKAKVIVAYSIWNTIKDGEEVTYRYIKGAAMLEKWKLLKEGIKEESINLN